MSSLLASSMIKFRVDPFNYCIQCSQKHRCKVIAKGHYCPPPNRTILKTGEISGLQSKLAFSQNGIVTDRKTFKERYAYWKSYLSTQ
ncbi:MAG: hypothetical protein [Circular genetic element sp.]|nr:MAG: hypothetical protein [Circular genetic element sp.]